MDNETGGRAVPVADAHENGAWIGWRCTIPPARLTPTHLPLHPQGDWLRVANGGKRLDFARFCLFHPAPVSPLETPSALRASVSLRLGHGAALTCHRHVIHYRAAAALPRRGAKMRRRFHIGATGQRCAAKF